MSESTNPTLNNESDRVDAKLKGIEDIPYELLYRILISIPYTDVISYCASSKSANTICGDDMFWLQKLDYELEFVSDKGIVFRLSAGIPQGREIAMQGLEYLLAKAKSPDRQAGFVHMLAPDGSVINPTRDCYDTPLSCWRWRGFSLGRDAQVRSEIDALVGFLDAGLRSPHGGFLEGIACVLAAPAKSPHASVRGDDRDLRRHPRSGVSDPRRRALRAVRRQLLRPRRQVLGEYFEDDWSKIEPVTVEAGHQAEWVWLLKAFERITGCPTGRFRASCWPLRCVIAIRRLPGR